MNYLSPEVFGAFCVALGSIGTAAFSYLRDRLKYGSADRRNLTEQVAKLFGHVGELNTELRALRGEVRERDRTIDQLQDQVRTLQSERDRLRDELAEARDDFAATQAELEGALVEARELKAEVARLRTQVEGSAPAGPS